jgi:uncharacterized Zn finger protein
MRTVGNVRRGINRPLEDALREMALEDGPEGLAAGFAAQDFLRRPSIGTYQALQAESEALGVWDVVRRRVLDTLATGAALTAHPEWPLPEAELPECETEERIDAPETRLLLEIALDEGDPRRVMRWYRRHLEQGTGTGYGGRWRSGSLEVRVAEATAEQFPDEAIAIWDRLARAEIDRTKRSAYEKSLSYLRPMQTLLRKLGREDEWDAYLSALREEHSRKRALHETLERLNWGPIIEQGD